MAVGVTGGHQASWLQPVAPSKGNRDRMAREGDLPKEKMELCPSRHTQVSCCTHALTHVHSRASDFPQFGGEKRKAPIDISCGFHLCLHHICIGSSPSQDLGQELREWGV